MIGRTVSHYRILSPLGSGGMGVVYLAEDARLGRQVALKFLPASYAQEAKALERFRVEARAASSLSHPAICAIYDIGQDGDTPFIVMEALKGETLRERIAKGALKVADVLDISIQLADALEAAHSQGIVHRDIKPANIFLSDRNRVKVLDFGLAKLTSSPSSLSRAADTTTPGERTHSNQITQPGTALGTVSYMSPEQARGEHIDSRTDLFSLGAVMYEMLTGRQAFGGSTTAIVYDAILNRAPRPIAELNPLIPQRLETVIATALEKECDLRYQHASDLQAELRRIRRDLEAGSLVGSQSVVTPRRESTPAPSDSATALANGGSRWLERSAIVVASLAILVAAVLFWRGQGTEVDRSVAPAEQASANPPVETTAPGNVPPPVVEPPANAPTENPPPAPITEALKPAPQPLPRVTPTPTPQPPANGRATLPPPAATPPLTTTLPATPAQPATTPPSPAAGNPPVTPPATQPADEVKPQPSPAPAPVPEPVALPPPPVQPATPPPRDAAPPPEPTPPAPVETDEAAIRRVIRIYEQAIETEDIALYRSVRPGLTKAAETVLMNSFRQIDSQEIELRVESLRIEGRTATARIARRDTLTTAGRRQTQNSTQTLRFEKTDAGWVIAELTGL
jgi:serine/threonine protein kinase